MHASETRAISSSIVEDDRRRLRNMHLKPYIYNAKNWIRNFEWRIEPIAFL